MIRAALLLALTLAAAAPAQQAPPPPVTPPPVAPPPVTPPPAPAVAATPVDLVRVTLATPAGPIVLALDRTHAPGTVANFLRYVDAKRLDGTAFYRTMKLGDGLGLVQFGTRNEVKRTYPGIPHEPTTKTGLSHTDGAISMAMNAPGTAAGDFFIIVGDLNTLDATPTNPGFAVFGRVVEGMDIVRRLLDSPTSPTEGEGVMKGQMLDPKVPVTTARRGG